MWVLGPELGSFKKAGGAVKYLAISPPQRTPALGFLGSALLPVLYFHAFQVYLPKRSLFTSLHLSVNCFLQYIPNTWLALFFISVFHLKPLPHSLCLFTNEVSGTKCTFVGAVSSRSLGRASPPLPSHTAVFLGHRVSMIWPEPASLVQAASAYLLPRSPF